MSLFRPASITCPACDTLIEVEESDSVNADRRPDLREAIIDGTFQQMNCPSCDVQIRLEPQFNYLEVGQSLWIAVFPPRMMPEYIEVEDSITDVFDNAYGKHAQPSARVIGDDLDVRLVFGWPALREKLVVRAAGLDDTLVELLKLDLMRRLPEAELGTGRELRVLAVDDDVLSFAWILPETETEMERFACDRALYDAIAGNPDGWAPIRAQLTDGPFVDMQKLYMGEGRDAAE
ncbi:CpXC domain-containing protein [Seohaeicola saemankumensis]|nr:CpXC domain-containing protein [Seohaeicola saemankumensis]MCA0872559.1 CpXC domain-containing protein [Seohaeicola saemankumensis]